jgi:hypothetical protein
MVHNHPLRGRDPPIARLANARALVERHSPAFGALSAGLPEPAFLRLISANARWMERAARAAPASFSCATG